MAVFADEIKEYAAELAKPISADAPSGRDASFEPAFETIKAELDKLSNVTGGIVDWKVVAQGASELTKGTTKDVRVLVWLVVARLKVDGPKGLAAALAACHQVCSQHWETLFPPLKRARARGNQFEWLFEQLDKQIPEAKLGSGDKEPLEVAADLCKELDSLASEKLGDHYTAVPRTATVLRQRAGEIAAPAPQATPQPTAQSTTTSAPNPTPVATSTSTAAPSIPMPEPLSVSGGQGATNALRSASMTVKAAALEFRRENGTRALAYTLPRIATWLLVERLPPSPDGQKTSLPAPRDKARLETLAANEKWTELLTASEELAATSPFWLDPHRFSALALERLGPTYADARKALEREVVHFVTRIPGITKLQFADGSPFADAACVAWIEGASEEQGGGGGSGKHQQLSEEEEELKARYEAAKELVASGKIDEGLELAHALSCRAPNARARFRSRLEVATLATRGNKPALACAILDALVKEGEQHRLDEWEPELVAQVYASLIAARRGSAATGVAGTVSDEELLARLCRLAPGQALRLSGR
jgi:type VI secretion system protein VasJ